MTNNRGSMQSGKQTCLTDDDLYQYISGRDCNGKYGQIETHLAHCSDCCHALGDLLRILHAEDDREKATIPELSKMEVDRTIAMIQEFAGEERSGKKSYSYWGRLPAAAAILIGFVGLTIWGLMHLNEVRKSRAYFLQAKAILERNYAGTSPGKLRLALPFNPASNNRSGVESEPLRKAENLFFQALAVRENMIEARLGIACIYLNESRFNSARAEFQKILDVRKGDSRALVGRGVAQYEEALRAPDPLQRDILLRNALGDFDAVLRQEPGAAEARFNKIWTLYELGRHKDALREIESYLSRDPGSSWAEELRRLRIKILATRTSAVDDEVNRAARERDKAALWDLAIQAPYQMPGAIWSAMRKSLEMESTPPERANPSSEDLIWAAETMEAAYGSATGDHSFRNFIDFYFGLSPPEREIKKSLDRRFQELVRLHQNGKYDAVLRSAPPLENQYEKIKDSWQLLNLYHLLGDSFYLGKADFRAAEAEFLKMHEIAENLSAPDLSAKALAALARVYGEQRKFDDSLTCANRVKKLAARYNLDSWQVAACITIGNQYRLLGQYPQALQEYTAGLSLACRLLKETRIVGALENSANVMDRLGRLQEAAALYSLAAGQHDSLVNNEGIRPSPELTMRRLNRLFKQGDLALRMGGLAGAESLFRESLSSAPRGMRELEARNRIGLAEVYYRRNRLAEAEAALGPALAIGSSGQYPDIEWQAKFLRGKLLDKAGNRKEALSSFQQAIEVLERMRGQVQSEDLRQSFFMDRFAPYKTMVASLYVSGGDKKKTLEFIDRAKSITLKEHLRLDEPAWRSSGNSSHAEIERDAHPTVEYFFTDEELLIFLTGAGHIESVSRRISKDELSRNIRDYLRSIQRNDASAFTGLSRRLYEELIAPIERLVFTDSSRTLVILPDGPLHLLPFAGLQDRQGRFLIEKIPVAMAPSRSVLRHCLLSGKGKPLEDQRAVLIDGSSMLPNAREELAYLLRLFGRNASVLAPGDLPTFRQAVARAGIVHFAGHAVDVHGKPALLLQASPNKIHLDCQAINTWRMPRCCMVNLAGCSTATGPLSEGEAPWGLVPALLNAGAPAIVASLFPVDDASTGRLSCRFYELLQKGAGKAKALQGAQLTLLDSARRNSDLRPQTWTPYILIGNPQ